MELASALTVATILADAAVTPTVSEMTYNVSSGTLNHTQPTTYQLLNMMLYTAVYNCLPLTKHFSHYTVNMFLQVKQHISLLTCTTPNNGAVRITITNRSIHL